MQGLGGQHARHDGQEEEDQGGGGGAETTDNQVCVAPRDTAIVFREPKPRGSEGQGYEPMGYNYEIYEFQGAQCVLSVHLLPIALGLRFVAPRFGITTPIMYTAPAPNPVLVRLLFPLL